MSDLFCQKSGRDEILLQVARTEYAGIENLHFELRDATALKFRAQFDVVTSSRAMQWIADPRLAVENMKRATKSGGVVIVLDYNHCQNQWEPESPAEFRSFYEAFLAWRRANGWDNEMADHIPELFRSVGLTSINSRAQNEVAIRGDQDFATRSFLWLGTLGHVARALVTAGFCSEAQLEEARVRYELWARTELMKQTLALRATIGIVP